MLNLSHIQCTLLINSAAEHMLLRRRFISNKTEAIPLWVSQAAVCVPDWLWLQHVVSEWHYRLESINKLSDRVT